MPVVPSILFCQQSDIEDVLSVDGLSLRLDDNNDGAVDATEQGRVTRSIYYATSRLGMYLSRYNAADLQQSQVVTEWAAIFATRWLCNRRGNGVPSGIQEAYDEAMLEIKEVQAGRMDLMEVAAREVPWFAWSNCRVSAAYRLRRIRVERPISEKTPTTYPQTRDIQADYYEFESST